MTYSQRRSMRALSRSLRAGLRPHARPDKALRARAALRRWGPTPAAACRTGAIWSPHRTAIVDDEGMLSFAELDRRTSALANGLSARGLTARDTVAVMCRNHRSPVEVLIACSKLGLNLVHLDPELSAAESGRILRILPPRVLIHDDEFTARLSCAPSACERLIAHAGGGHAGRSDRLDRLIDTSATSSPPPVPSRNGRTITFAGTQGAEDQSLHTVPGSLLIPGVLSSGMPLRPRQTTVICAPLARPWGHLHLTLALRLSSTIVLHRRFDPLQAIASIDEHQPDALALTPGMLEGIMGLPRETLAWYDTSALRVIAVRDRTLAGELAIPVIARFGAILYSLRGPSIVALSPRAEASRVALAGPGGTS